MTHIPFTPPEHEASAFNCPICGAYAKLISVCKNKLIAWRFVAMLFPIFNSLKGCEQWNFTKN